MQKKFLFLLAFTISFSLIGGKTVGQKKEQKQSADSLKVAKLIGKKKLTKTDLQYYIAIKKMLANGRQVAEITGRKLDEELGLRNLHITHLKLATDIIERKTRYSLEQRLKRMGCSRVFEALCAQVEENTQKLSGGKVAIKKETVAS